MSDAADGFLARWSRRKARVQEGLAEQVEPLPTGVGTPVVAAETAVPVESPPPEMPPPEAPAPLPTMDDVVQLTRNSDFSRFVGPGVDPGVSNAAMKKLFSDPRYNVMDGLDTYIDDYGKPDPIPLAMLRQMNQAKFLRLFDDDEEAAATSGAVVASAPGDDATTFPEPATSTDGAPATAVAESSPLPEPGSPDRETEARTDDDADLRLQQDDAVERPGAAQRPRR